MRPVRSGRRGPLRGVACSDLLPETGPLLDPHVLWGQENTVTTTKHQFAFRIDTWTPDGESIVEQVALVEDYKVALATFRAACERWPNTPISCDRAHE
jgi:hypothetical protein